VEQNPSTCNKFFRSLTTISSVARCGRTSVLSGLQMRPPILNTMVNVKRTQAPLIVYSSGSWSLVVRVAGLPEPYSICCRFCFMKWDMQSSSFSSAFVYTVRTIIDIGGEDGFTNYGYQWMELVWTIEVELTRLFTELGDSWNIMEYPRQLIDHRHSGLSG